MEEVKDQIEEGDFFPENVENIGAHDRTWAIACRPCQARPYPRSRLLGMRDRLYSPRHVA